MRHTSVTPYYVRIDFLIIFSLGNRYPSLRIGGEGWLGI